MLPSLQDLFTANYGSAPAAVPGWQNGLSHGMGFGLQCNPNGMVSCALGFCDFYLILA